MHPNRAFRWTDRDEMLAFVREVSFAHLFFQADGGLRVAHVPLVVTPAGALRFHLARSNRAADGLDGATALASVVGAHGYVSPDWYGSDDQVPTWNYAAVEAVGTVRRLGQPALVQLLDELSEEQERRLAPKPPWRRAKMSPGRFEGMLKAIEAYELEVEELRGTLKLGQHKAPAERAGAAAGVRSTGNFALADAMERTGR